MRRISEGDKSLGAAWMWWSILFAVVLVVWPVGNVFAQTWTKFEDFKTQLATTMHVSSLAEDSFGDQTDWYSGSTSFLVTDVSLRGNNELPVAYQRSLRAFDDGVNGWFQWTRYEVPYISGLFKAASQWQDILRGFNRCSIGMTPPEVTQSSGKEETFFADEYWHGNFLYLPGQGTQKLMGSRQLAPADGRSYKAMTNSYWHIACLPETANGAPGEGFIAIAPNGTKYYFDWLIQAGSAAAIKKDADAGGTTVLSRSEYRMLATKIEDRFGNWVKYSYSGEDLSSITSSDGRAISITYLNPGGAVATVNAAGKSWQYDYGSGFTVIRPDGSTWSSSLSGSITRYSASGVNCVNNPSQPYSGSYTLTVKQPSGVIGQFEFRPMRRGLSYVLFKCVQESFYASGYPEFHRVIDNIALFKKTVSGLGIPTQVWNVVYGPSNECYVHDTYSGRCVATSPVTRQVEITEPGNIYRRYTFGNKFRETEGMLQKIEVGAVGTNPLRTATYTWDDLGPAGNPVTTAGRDWVALRRRLEKSVVSAQDGILFARTINSRDPDFDYPINVSKSSTIPGNGTKTEISEHHNDLSLWVLGQVKRTTVNGIEASKTDYGWKALPWKTYAFGKLQQTFSYDSTSTVASSQLGTLKTVTDGRNNVTTLTGWKRGIPGKITYPATTDQPTPVFQQAAINDDGTIASITDETLSKTCYEYDEMLRIEKIIYPSETANVCDASKWTPTTITFKAGNPEAYGVPAGHWRQTTLTGRGRKILIFDALWRPVVEQTLDLDRVSTTTSEVIKRYDAAGRLAFQSYPMNTGGAAVYSDTTLKGTDYTYDALDRLKTTAQDSELGALTTTTDYLTGFQTRVTNPRGKQTLTTLYQAFDQPTYDFPRGINHPTDASTPASFTEISRDIFGKPTSIKRRNTDGTVAVTRSYAYHPSQELCRTVEPETGATLMGYDGAGNLAWSAAGLPAATACDLEGDATGIPARKITRAYDARNRLVHVYHPDGRGNIAYTYTPDSLPAQIGTNNDPNASQSATTTYAYNRRRLLETETLAYSSVLSWPVDYVYNTNGHLSAQIWHGLNVGYAPDALGRPTQAGTFASGVSYHPNGGIKQFTYGNGIIHQLTQNVRGLPRRSLDIYGSTHQLDDTYDFDQNGNVLAISDGRDAAQRRNVDMTYDGLDRLTSAVSPMFGTATYAYDVLDNLSRTQVTGGNLPRNHYYCYDRYDTTPTNRLDFVRTGATCTGSTPSQPVWALEYDLQGNLKNKNAQTFAFDYGNRLRSVNTPASTYAYDGLGRRVWDRTTDDKYSNYLQNGQLSMTGDERAKEVAEYIYLQGSLVAIRERNTVTNVYTTKYQHTDALGSPVAVTDANRALIAVEKNEFEPYGRVANRALTDGPNYTGHLADAATGLVYAQQRYYDPGIGRFLSADPVAVRESGDNFNRYWYANNNPYKFTDPDGRDVNGQYHSVIPGFAYHLSIRMTPINQALYKNDPRFITDSATGKRYATLGAGPERVWSSIPNPTYSRFGPWLTLPTSLNLVSGINRENDADMSLHPEAKDLPIAIPSQFGSEDEFIEALFAADANYADDVPYGLPGGDGFNSNSYANGVLQAVGAGPLVAPVNTPLSERPLPEEKFGGQGN